MPSEDTTTISMTPATRKHLATIARRAKQAGKPFPMVTRDGEKVVKVSPVVHAALAHAAEHMTFGAQPKAPGVTAPARPTEGAKPDAARLQAALDKAGLKPRTLETNLGLTKGTVRNVLGGLTALAKAGKGHLLLWIERQEKV